MQSLQCDTGTRGFLQMQKRGRLINIGYGQQPETAIGMWRGINDITGFCARVRSQQHSPGRRENIAMTFAQKHFLF